MTSLSQVRQDFYALRGAITRQDDQHISLTRTKRKSMQAIKTKCMFPILLANFFITIILLYVSLWDHMVLESLQSALTRLLDLPAQCPDGTTVGGDQNASSSGTPLASYNPPPYKHGSNGLAILATYNIDKSHYSPTNTYSMTGEVW